MADNSQLNTPQLQDETASEESVGQSRREIFGASMLAAAGLLWKPGQAQAQGGGRGGDLVFDVACLGTSFAPDLASALGNGDNRGLSFYVEGLIFPAGTIVPGSTNFDPSSVPAIGHWLCRGWFMNYPGRPAPGAVTAQEYLLSVIDSVENPSPRDTLVSSGLEGGPANFFTRAVVGGSGKYRHARGEVVQETIGTNTTILNVFNANAPNFRFYFTF